MLLAGGASIRVQVRDLVAHLTLLSSMLHPVEVRVVPTKYRHKHTDTSTTAFHIKGIRNTIRRAAQLSTAVNVQIH